MASFHETFKNPHVVLPVIHVENSTQAIKNTALALGEGADGVFLISMEGDNVGLLKTHKLVREQFAKPFIGLNMLGVDPITGFSMVDSSVSGLWTDTAFIFPGSHELPRAVLGSKKENGYEGLYFGGFEFKYQPRARDEQLEEMAIVAKDFMDVITTSGEATGSPPTVEKIERIRAAVGDFPLAIASGMDFYNVRSYLAADCFLVASSLLKPGKEDFDRIKLRDFIANVRG